MRARRRATGERERERPLRGRRGEIAPSAPAQRPAPLGPAAGAIESRARAGRASGPPGSHDRAQRERVERRRAAATARRQRRSSARFAVAGALDRQAPAEAARAEAGGIGAASITTLCEGGSGVPARPPPRDALFNVRRPSLAVRAAPSAPHTPPAADSSAASRPTLRLQNRCALFCASVGVGLALGTLLLLPLVLTGHAGADIDSGIISAFGASLWLAWRLLAAPGSLLDELSAARSARRRGRALEARGARRRPSPLRRERARVRCRVVSARSPTPPRAVRGERAGGRRRSRCAGCSTRRTATCCAWATSCWCSRRARARTSWRWGNSRSRCARACHSRAGASRRAPCSCLLSAGARTSPPCSGRSPTHWPTAPSYAARSAPPCRPQPPPLPASLPARLICGRGSTVAAAA